MLRLMQKNKLWGWCDTESKGPAYMISENWPELGSLSRSAQALQSAGFSLEPGSLDGLDLSKCGILIGTAMGGMQTFTSAVEDLTLKACPQIFIIARTQKQQLGYDQSQTHQVHSRMR